MGYIEELRTLIGTRPLILPGSTILVLNCEKQILMQQRLEPNGVWGLPGGLMELSESVEETARRELYEETSLLAEELHLLGVYSGGNYYVKLKNGDEYYSLTTAFICQKWTGQPVNDETEGIQLQFFDLENLPEKIVGSHKRMIEDYKKKTSIFS